MGSLLLYAGSLATQRHKAICNAQCAWPQAREHVLSAIEARGLDGPGLQCALQDARPHATLVMMGKRLRAHTTSTVPQPGMVLCD